MMSTVRILGWFVAALVYFGALLMLLTYPG